MKIVRKVVLVDGNLASASSRICFADSTTEAAALCCSTMASSFNFARFTAANASSRESELMPDCNDWSGWSALPFATECDLLLSIT